MSRVCCRSILVVCDKGNGSESAREPPMHTWSRAGNFATCCAHNRIQNAKAGWVRILSAYQVPDLPRLCRSTKPRTANALPPRNATASELPVRLLYPQPPLSCSKLCFDQFDRSSQEDLRRTAQRLPWPVAPTSLQLDSPSGKPARGRNQSWWMMKSHAKIRLSDNNNVRTIVSLTARTRELHPPAPQPEQRRRPRVYMLLLCFLTRGGLVSSTSGFLVPAEACQWGPGQSVT